MNIVDYIYKKVILSSDSASYDANKLRRGITCFSSDNGFEKLNVGYSEAVIKRVVDNALFSILSMRKEWICVYFENYELVEAFRMFSNKVLSTACKTFEGKPKSSDALLKLEGSLSDYLNKIYAIPELSQFMAQNISDCVMDLDYATGSTEQMSIRMMKRIRK